ncbi:MAG: hypothetical protein IPM42_22275 [Saprospiraceae bacterium]|nr:hypothetical protein [Saprospiraceae bacterium]
MDSDRKRTNAGAVTDLETEIAKTIQKRRRVLFEIQTPSRKRFDPVIPIIIPFGGSGNNKIEFSDDQIERLADAISERGKGEQQGEQQPNIGRNKTGNQRGTKRGQN